MSLPGKPPLAASTRLSQASRQNNKVSPPLVHGAPGRGGSRQATGELRRSSSMRGSSSLDDSQENNETKYGKTAVRRSDKFAADSRESQTGSPDVAAGKHEPSIRPGTAGSSSGLVVNSARQSAGSASANESRRVELLRSQVIQLERQLLIQQAALSSRAASFMELDVALSNLSENCKRQLATEGASSAVPVQRSELTRTISELEAMRRAFSKQGDLALSTQKELPVDGALFPEVAVERYLAQPAAKSNGSPKRKGASSTESGVKKAVTLFDLYANPQAALSLRNVAELEERLRELYESCVRLRSQLPSQRVASTSSGLAFGSRSRASEPSTDELESAVRTVSEQLVTACDELFTLSLLVPSCAWKRSRRFDASVASERLDEKHEPLDERIRRFLGALRNAQHRAQAEALFGCLTHAVEMQQRRVRALESALSSAKEDKANANANVKKNNSSLSVSQRAELRGRVRELRDAFERLRDGPTQSALRDFVGLFEEHFDDETFAKLDEALT